MAARPTDGGPVDGDAGWAGIDRIAATYTGGPYPLREGRLARLVEPGHVLTADVSQGPAE